MHESAVVARLGLAGLFLAALGLGGCGAGVPVSGNAGSTSTAGSGASTTSSSSPATQITLSGAAPTSVVVGATYSYQPSVSPSVSGVTFTIVQQPTWASFDSSTGALTGTPSASNVGTTSNIEITASYGGSSSSVGPFSIVVDAAQSVAGSATLTWDAPTVNSDGTALNGLAGYRIYYGPTPDALTTEIDVAGAATTTYVVNGLASGTYYFAVTAYSSVGTESGDSNVASKTI
jgi:hypothetical protein